MMAEGRRREEWNHTSHVLAWVENFCFRAKLKSPRFVSPRTLNPMLPKEVPIKVPLSILAGMFTGKPN